MMSLSTISCILLVLSLSVCLAEENVKSLCEEPYIHSADRLLNNTYRVYRDNHYWELIGLPDRVAKVKGPFPISLPNLGPVDVGTSIVTIIGGPANGYTTKYKGRKWWSWDAKGNQAVGGKDGEGWWGLPEGGWNAAYSDGDLPKSPEGPHLIAFRFLNAYYWNTKYYPFRGVANTDTANGHMGGFFGEKFPSDLTAAMAFPSNDPKHKYFVYLFKREKYCYRPITGEDGCKEWRDNKELFGCNSAPPEGGTGPPAGNPSTPSPPNGDSDSKPPGGNGPSGDSPNKPPEEKPGHNGSDSIYCPHILLLFLFLMNLL